MTKTEMYNQIEQMYLSENMTVPQIADELGVSTSKIKHIIAKCHISKSGYISDNKKEENKDEGFIKISNKLYYKNDKIKRQITY